MVTLKIVSNVSRFKPAHNLNRVLADLNRGSNSLNSISGLQDVWTKKSLWQKRNYFVRWIVLFRVFLIKILWILCFFSCKHVFILKDWLKNMLALGFASIFYFNSNCGSIVMSIFSLFNKTQKQQQNLRI